MPARDREAGEHLRKLRARAGLTLQQVEDLSKQLACFLRDGRWRTAKSRLCDIETRGRMPGIHCLAALAFAYSVDVRDLLELYGIPSDFGYNEPARADSHASTQPSQSAASSGLDFRSLSNSSSRPTHCE
jgi:transcriptional regulator with XRE-family HTH domain